jgi:hypothetical protein
LKAYRAYIAGLGTTGVLIGSFLLLLAVVSTIVAFRGAPGEASNEGLGRLDVSDSRPASQLSAAPAGSEADRGRQARDRGAAARGSKRRGSVTGRIGGDAGAARGERSAGGFAGVTADGAAPSQAAGGDSGKGEGPGGGARLPVNPRDVGSPPAPPTVGDVATGLGDAVEQTGSGVGETVGTAAPPLETPIVRTGETAAGVVRDAAPVVDQTVDDVTGVADQVTGGLGVGGGN